jgi:predicted TIM-barrel fold metal-dependent hydrolase
VLIDAHTHLGRLRHGDPGLTPQGLLCRMDDHGVDVAVVLTVESPEELDYYVPTAQVLSWCAGSGGRLVPLCGCDPRHRYPGSFDPYPILAEHAAAGCRGLGENLCGLPIDDPLQRRVYEACARLRLPVLLHIDHHINRDAPGLPGLERLLRDYPEVTFIGHGQHFWREISADAGPDTPAYPSGPVAAGGRVEELLQRYRNLRADLSAGSGYNALRRDVPHALGFLERCHRSLLFGTDVLAAAQDLPIVSFFRGLHLSVAAREDIAWRNAASLFRIGVPLPP